MWVLLMSLTIFNTDHEDEKQGCLCLGNDFAQYSCKAESPIAENIQQMFVDDLLTSYQQMETSFAKHLYQFYKGFEFTLPMECERQVNKVSNDLQVKPRSGTGKLQGVF
ncbi:hypothetical protein OS493_031031 [Desmophyllum pertusum]|uniref:Uncharacterized protein n=1 Tax=Desmophyllum pertusum TaxID=174260 RepID=A0A9W9Z8J4_9CNID|nr:hypothetical protein OS493_031031 [Desmophyllum pertusum]